MLIHNRCTHNLQGWCEFLIFIKSRLSTLQKTWIFASGWQKKKQKPTKIPVYTLQKVFYSFKARLGLLKLNRVFKKL